MFLFGAEPKVIAKIEKLVLGLGYRYVTQVQLMVTAKSEICFDSGQFVRGAKIFKKNVS